MALESALTSLLSGVASGRRWWGRAPEGTSPADGAYLVLNRISGIRDYTMAGGSGYVESRVQIDAYAEEWPDARAASAAVITALSAHRGTTAGTRIMGIFVDSERDLDASDAGGVSHLFRRSIDLIVHHDE